MDAWLYIVLIGGVAIMYAWLLPISAKPPVQQHILKEIEDTIVHFSSEMEKENRQLLQLVSEMKKEHEMKADKLLGRIQSLEQQNNSFPHKLKPDLPSQPLPVEQPLQVEPPSQVEKPPVESSSMMNIRARYNELFVLCDQGKSTEYIAKKLGMNKGEVLLIMQLARQEEQLRA